jgi:O-succinylbenzoate synthase
MAEITAMSDAELAAACRVVGYQVAAPLLVGDRDERRGVLAMLHGEAAARGLL